MFVKINKRVDKHGEMTCTANFIKLEFPGTRTVVSIPALGHTEETDKGADPTCTEPGKTEGKHCSVCNEVLVAQKTVDPLGHDWGDWKVTVEPEIGKAGVKEHECTRCKMKETEAIPALIGYTVSSGGATSWTKGGSGSIIITVNRSEDDENCFTHYAETLIDGNPVTVSAKAGSTVVEIGADVLNSLGTGAHTITVRFDDGEVVTTVNVKEKQEDSFPIKSPDTSGRGGYDKMALLLTGVMVLTLAGAVTVRRYTE